jgi:hypothetical protein
MQLFNTTKPKVHLFYTRFSPIIISEVSITLLRFLKTHSGKSFHLFVLIQVTKASEFDEAGPCKKGYVCLMTENGGREHDLKSESSSACCGRNLPDISFRQEHRGLGRDRRNPLWAAHSSMMETMPDSRILSLIVLYALLDLQQKSNICELQKKKWESKLRWSSRVIPALRFQSYRLNVNAIVLAERNTVTFPSSHPYRDYTVRVRKSYATNVSGSAETAQKTAPRERSINGKQPRVAQKYHRPLSETSSDTLLWQKQDIC